jgi:glycosyltransferase involved in cell wall biosynthesis
LRIAHINNIAGVASTLAEYQKKQGHKTDVYVFNKLIYKQFGGILINYMSPVSRWRLLRKLSNDYDIWHYHYPYGSLKSSMEKRHKDKIYLKHYHGDDIRGKYDDGFCLVSTPDLLKYVPNGKWLPTPIDLSLLERIAFTEHYTERSNKFRLVRYPAYRDFQSFADLSVRALKCLEKENKCEVVDVFGVPYHVALQAISTSDIVIGKILPNVGWFGKFELEGMALSKPVIGYVSDELYEKYKPPIYRTTPETFKTDLESLTQDDAEKHRLAIEGHNYVKKYHAAEEIVKQVDDYYDDLDIKHDVYNNF